MRYPNKNRDRCLYHGGEKNKGLAGTTPRSGIGTPIAKRWSKKLGPLPTLEGTPIEEIYRQVLEQDMGCDMTHELILLRSQYINMLERNTAGESYKTWEMLRKAWNDLAQAKNPEDVESYINQIGTLIQKGSTESDNEKEIRAAIVDFSKVAGSQSRIADMERRSMSPDQANVFTNAVFQIVTELLKDDMAKLMSFRRGMQKLADMAANSPSRSISYEDQGQAG